MRYIFTLDKTTIKLLIVYRIHITILIKENNKSTQTTF